MILISTSLAAKILGISQERMCQLARSGQVPCHRVQAATRVYGRVFDREVIVQVAQERLRQKAQARDRNARRPSRWAKADRQQPAYLKAVERDAARSVGQGSK